MSEVEDVADRLHSVAIHLLRRVRRADAATGISPAELSTRAGQHQLFGRGLRMGHAHALVRSPSA